MLHHSIRLWSIWSWLHFHSCICFPLHVTSLQNGYPSIYQSLQSEMFNLKVCPDQQSPSNISQKFSLNIAFLIFYWRSPLILFNSNEEKILPGLFLRIYWLKEGKTDQRGPEVFFCQKHHPHPWIPPSSKHMCPCHYSCPPLFFKHLCPGPLCPSTCNIFFIHCSTLHHAFFCTCLCSIFLSLRSPSCGSLLWGSSFSANNWQRL